jgi:hypothetical protein
VCRPGGRIVFLNHFLNDGRILSKFERAIAPLTVHLGFSQFPICGRFLHRRITGRVDPEGERPRIWSLVIVRKGAEPPAAQAPDRDRRLQGVSQTISP